MSDTMDEDKWNSDELSDKESATKKRSRDQPAKVQKKAKKAKQDESSPKKKDTSSKKKKKGETTTKKDKTQTQTKKKKVSSPKKKDKEDEPVAHKTSPHQSFTPEALKSKVKSKVKSKSNKDKLPTAAAYHNDTEHRRNVSRSEAEEDLQSDEEEKMELIDDDEEGDEQQVSYDEEPRGEIDEDEDVEEVEDMDEDIVAPCDVMTEKDRYFMKPLIMAKQALEDLDTPFDHHNLDDLDDDHLYMQLDVLEQLWKVPERYEADERSIDRVTKRNLEFALTKDIFDINLLNDKMTRMVFTVTKNLMLRFGSKLLINNPNYDASSDNSARFNRLFDIQHHFVVHLGSSLRLKAYAKEKTKHELPITLTLLKYSSGSNEDMTSFQRALFVVLEKLYDLNLRRKDKDVYEPIWTSDGHYTYAWRKICDIDTYVHNIFNLDTEWENFLKLTKSSGLPREISQFLTYFNSSYFPELRSNSYLWAFNNGVYYSRKDIFVSYSVEEENKKARTEWEELENRGDREPVSKISLLDIKADIEINSNSSSSSLGRKLDLTLVAHKFIDAEFQDWRKKENIKPRPFPEKKSNLSTKRRVELEKQWEQKELLRKEKWIGKDWADIYAPAFDSIFESQGFKKDVKGWCYGLTGMALYPGGELENWQVAMMVLGYAGTGKSSWLKTIRELFELENVGILSNNVERQWALAAIYNKCVVLGYEVRKDFKWEQGEFQNCVTHEEVLVMIKHKTAFASPFLAPIFMAGNEMITSWQDNSGSLARRMVIIYFRHFISKNKSDPRLHEKILDELPDILQKINRAYLFYVSKYGECDIWSVLPTEFIEWNEEAMQSTNALLAFLKKADGELFEISKADTDDPELFWCPFKEFKDAFKQWHYREYGKKPEMTWNKDNYDAPFSRMQMAVKPNVERMYEGKKQRQIWLSGISMMPDWRMIFEDSENQTIAKGKKDNKYGKYNKSDK